MSNIIEKHPGYTLLIVIVSVMTTTWAILTFVLEDNKINFYKAQVESVKAETENIKSTNSQYQARIEYLEKENEKLTELNKSYLDWISKGPTPLPFFKKRIEDLTAENLRLIKQGKDTVSVLIGNNSNPNNTTSKYNITRDIKSGQAYFDDSTGVTVGVTEINVTYESTLQITFPDKSTKNEKIAAGKVYYFQKANRSYQIILKRVEYIYGYVSIQIVEK